jgi:hypothetical protein
MSFGLSIWSSVSARGPSAIIRYDGAATRGIIVRTTPFGAAG